MERSWSMGVICWNDYTLRQWTRWKCFIHELAHVWDAYFYQKFVESWVFSYNDCLSYRWIVYCQSLKFHIGPPFRTRNKSLAASQYFTVHVYMYYVCRSDAILWLPTIPIAIDCNNFYDSTTYLMLLLLRC